MLTTLNKEYPNVKNATRNANVYFCPFDDFFFLLGELEKEEIRVHNITSVRYGMANYYIIVVE